MGRPVAAVGAVALIAEALGIALVNLVLGLAVKRQSMSLAGLRPSAMSAGAWAAGGVFAVFLILCALLLIRTAVTDRAPGHLARILLIVCAVVHGVVGAAVVGIVGWPAFIGMMVVLGLLVWTLLSYADAGPGTGEGKSERPAPSPGPGTASPTSP